MIGGLGVPELVIILGIALLVFGASRLPGIARSLGKAIQEFRHVGKEITDSVEKTMLPEGGEKTEDKDS